PSLGNWNLTSGGTIKNGNVTAGNGATLTVTGGTLDGMTLSAATTVNNDAVLTVLDGLTLNSTLTMTSTGSYAGTFVNFNGSQTLGGSGEVLFSQTGAPGWTNTLRPTSGALTIGPQITIAGTQGVVGNATLPLINNGTIDAESGGGTFTIQGSNLTNNGTIEAASGDILVLAGSFTNEGLNLNASGFQAGGAWVDIAGTLDNTGATLTLDPSLGNWNLTSGGTIKNGNVTAGNGATLTVTGGTLDGMTLSAATTVNNDAVLTVLDGLTLNSTLTMTSTGSYAGTFVNFNGSQTLGGSGEVLFSQTGAPGWTNTLRPTSGALTIGPQITIAGTQGVVGNATLPLINNGTIDAESGGGTFTIQGSNLTNNGTIEAASGDILVLAGSFTNEGLNLNASGFQAGGAWVDIAGTLDNTGATLTLDPSLGNWNLTSGGTIKNGNVTAGNGATLTVTGGTLDGMTLSAATTVNNDAVLTVLDGLTLNSTLTMTSTGSYAGTFVNFNGSQTLGGSGEVLFSQTGAPGWTNTLRPTSGALTIGPQITIAGTQGVVGNATLPLINNGTIDAESGGTMTVTATPFTNNGDLLAFGGILSLPSAQVNGSSEFSSSATGTFIVTGDLTGAPQNANLFTPNGTLRLSGSGTALSPQHLEAMSMDDGGEAAGFIDNFAYGVLELGNGTHLQLQPNGSKAVYVNTLIVPAGTTLDLNGVKLYYREKETDNGTIDDPGDLMQVPGGGTIAIGSVAAGY